MKRTRRRRLGKLSRIPLSTVVLTSTLVFVAVIGLAGCTRTGVEEEADRTWIYAILSSDAVINAVVTIVGMIWTALLGWLGYNKAQENKYDEAIEIFNDAVYNTYVTYVKAIRDELEKGGKLTNAQATEARERAIKYAVERGKNEGLDVLKIIGKEAAPRIISAIVGRMKRGTADE